MNFNIYIFYRREKNILKRIIKIKFYQNIKMHTKRDRDRDRDRQTNRQTDRQV